MIELDRPRMLWFGHKALKTLAAMTGKDIDATLNMDNLEDLEKVIYCGLLTDAKAHNEVLKLEDMEDLLDKGNLKDIMLKLQQAFENAFGTADDMQKNFQGTAEKKKK